MKNYHIHIIIAWVMFLPMLVSAQKTNRPPKETIGIQPGYVSPFQKNSRKDNPKTIRPDHVDPYTFEKYDNTYWIKFSPDSKITASTFFDSLKTTLRLSDKEKYNLQRSDRDELGMTHTCFQQTYQGIEVEGGQFLLHEKNGYLQTANGNYYDNLNINTMPTLTPEAAIQLAKKHIGAEKWMWENPQSEQFIKETKEDSTATYTPKPELIIAPLQGEYKSDKFRLCYKINIAAESPFSEDDVYVDAHTGEVINQISQIQDLTEPNAETLYSGNQTITTQYYNGKYRLRDDTRGHGIETYDMRDGTDFQAAKDFTDADNNWTKENALKKVVISTINNNWDSFLEGGGKPDLYIAIKDGNNDVVYKSTTLKDTLPQVTFYLYLALLNPPYTLEIWDSDSFIFGDLLGSFPLQVTNGTINYSDNGIPGNETSGHYIIALESNPALDVHWAMEKTYDFYKDSLGRNSYDGYGAKIKNYIYVSSDLKINDQPLSLPNNAFAHPSNQFMIFGLGDGIKKSPLVSVDVAAHEFTHSVIKFNGHMGLLYQNESGALNESFADIFGTAIEHFAIPDSANWTIGEKYVLPHPNYSRSLSNPNSGHPPQPDTYKSTNPQGKWYLGSVDDDYGGVHYNSGVQNFWFYLLSEGGSGTNDKGQNYSVTGIGIEKATRIAYKNLTTLMMSNSQYIDAANGSKNAAMFLFPGSNSELQSVIQAWYAVGVFNSPTGFCSGTTSLTASSGTLKDGSGNAPYENNSDCKWLIHPNGANTITLNFTAFNTESGHDSITVYDGATPNAPVLLTWYGNSLPPAVTSSTGAMLVRFQTDEMTVGNGWEANYTSGTSSSSCEGFTILNASAGTVTDGSGNNNYGNNADCSWLIAPPGATSISLSFTSFNTEASTDGIIVFDGPDTNYPLLGSYTGSSLPPVLTSTGGEVLIVFLSDNDITAPGWSVNYTSTGSAYCSGTTNLTALSGTFSNGSGTENYQNNSDCSWLIQPAGATSVTLSFNSFDLELPSSDGQSIYDAVEVYDGPNTSAPLLGTFTGTNLPPSLTTTGGAMFVHFFSDFSETAPGWSASYTSTTQGYCSGTSTLTSASGSFSDGSGSNQYVENADCRWLIKPANATSIVLTFSNFDTEQDYDGVIVYDGDNIYAPELAVITGSSLPATISSTGGAMLVRFLSDNTTNGNGWSASYSANISTGGSGSINAYEYWFDNNYASKVFHSVTPVNTYHLNTNIPTTGLTNGLHTIHIRFSDHDGQWSSVLSDFFHKLPPSTNGNRKIIAFEYWFDNDYDSKIYQTVSPQVTYVLNTGIDATALTQGLHNYHIRYKDDGGQWSSVLSDFFHKLPITSNGTRKIVAYEYWFDNDYDSKVYQTVSPQETYVLNTGINAAALPQGLHNYHIQYKDDGGQWSSVLSDYFHKLGVGIVPNNLITGYRYWFDMDNAGMVSVNIPSPVNQFELIQNICTENLPLGNHTVHFQFRDSLQAWSSVLTDTINKIPSTLPVITYNGPATLCPNGSITLTASPGTTYLWSTGATTESIQATNVGSYSVMVNYGGGCSLVSESLNITLRTTSPEICNSIDDDCDGSVDNNLSVCPIPSGLLVSNITSSSAVLYWENAPCSISMWISWHDLAGNTGGIHVTTSSALLSNLLPGTTYEVTAMSDCGGAMSVSSIPVSFTTLYIYFQDADGDGYGNPAVTTAAATLPAGYAVNNTDCNDNNASIRPGAAEICNSLDDNCNGLIDDVISSCPMPPNTSTTNIKATSAVLNWSAVGCATEYRIQYRLFGATAYLNGPTVFIPNISVTLPGLSPSTKYQWRVRAICTDGSSTANTNPLTFTTLAPLWFQDADGDGYGNPSVTINASPQPAGYVANNTDCNDNNAAIRPNALETCNSIDDNCNGNIDEGVLLTFYRDADGDGYGLSTNTTLACSPPSGYVANLSDCNDAIAAIHPGATESCNGLDDNCNGNIDEGVLLTFYADADGDGYGISTNTTLACSPPAGFVANLSDCNDANAAIHPGAAETCNGLDDNCNGNIDEGQLISFYPDADGDGYGIGNNVTQSCSPPVGYAPNNSDCNDGNAAVNPGATEICNSIDDNCNGQIDEVLASCTTPLNPAHSNIQAYAADLSWSSVICATEYRIQYRVFGAPAYTNGPIISVPNLSVNLGGLLASTHYQWRVRAICYNGSSTVNTNPLDFTTLPPPVPWYQDTDGDGFGNPAVSVTSSLQPAGYVANNTDCNDNTGPIGPTIYPGAPELCDNLDNNCNGQIDEGVGGGTCPIPAGLSTTEITYQSARVNWTRTECVASYVIQYRMVGAPSYTNGPTVNFPGTTAVLYGLLESTNYQWRIRSICFNGTSSQSSQPQPFTTPSSIPTWYADSDGDGYGNPASMTMASVQPAGYVANHTDCNDANANIRPGALEYCNGIDDDCDGLVDEAAVDCPTPTGQTVTTITATKARLNWQASNCATTYNVQYRIRGTTTWSSRNVTTLFLQLSNLIPGTQYEWRIRAKCGLYFSPFTSPLVRFTTLASLVSAENDQIQSTDKTTQKTRPADRSPRFTVSPNPSNGMFNLFAKDLVEGTSQVRVFDQLGRNCYLRSVPVANGEIRMQIDLTALSAGLFYLQLMNGNEVWVEKVSIW